MNLRSINNMTPLKSDSSALRFYFLWLLLLGLSQSTMAASMLAPSNDNCSKAILLKDVSNYCSSPKQFTTDGATASGLPAADCFNSFLLEPDNDVWFKFKAIANTVNISVIGAITGTPKGTLRNPQIALYAGGCGSSSKEIACISDGQGYHIVETFISDLAIGGTYYIRVDGRAGKTGSFQLCVNNYNPTPSPSSDCSSAVVLCDKSPFTVPSITGAGKNRFELPSGICLEEESSSAWYKWTCDKAGTLTFVLKPVNPADDIDFALFQLPNGVDNCNEKIPVRCMASGEDVNEMIAGWSRCTGATGLKPKSLDLSEEAGCAEWDDNFVAGIRMLPGESYALLVNNYHNTGNGFSIEFGGSGTFKGPTAHFVVSKLKINQDQELWVRNKSDFEGTIEQWQWNFGVDAKPSSAKGIGPHKVRYKTSGKKSISLVIETDNGCQVTKVRQITVVEPPPPPPEPEPTLESEPAASGPSIDSVSPKPADPSPPPVNTPAPSATPAPAPAPPVSETVKSSPDTTMVEVQYDVKYTATIFFDSDSSALDNKDLVTLYKVLHLLEANPSYKAIVEGHTNNIPDEQYCNKLATERASIVIQWLKGKSIGEERIIRKIFGKDQVKETEETKYKNRKRYQKAVVRLVQRE